MFNRFKSTFLKNMETELTVFTTNNAMTTIYEDHSAKALLGPNGEDY